MLADLHFGLFYEQAFPYRSPPLFQEVTGYQTKTWRVALCHIGSVLTAGLLLILFHWKPSLEVQVKCTPCALSQADWVIIRVSPGKVRGWALLLASQDVLGHVPCCFPLPQPPPWLCVSLHCPCSPDSIWEWGSLPGTLSLFAGAGGIHGELPYSLCSAPVPLLQDRFGQCFTTRVCTEALGEGR